jgi:hypothetical protein
MVLAGGSLVAIGSQFRIFGDRVFGWVGYAPLSRVASYSSAGSSAFPYIGARSLVVPTIVALGVALVAVGSALVATKDAVRLMSWIAVAAALLSGAYLLYLWTWTRSVRVESWVEASNWGFWFVAVGTSLALAGATFGTLPWTRHPRAIASST